MRNKNDTWHVIEMAYDFHFFGDKIMEDMYCSSRKGFILPPKKIKNGKGIIYNIFTFLFSNKISCHLFSAEHGRRKL